MMIQKEKYEMFVEILKKAAFAFAKPPVELWYNDTGLCHFFRMILRDNGYADPTIEKILEEILGPGYYNNERYTIAYASQDLLWQDDSFHFYNRSEWCKQRSEYFKQKLKEIT